MNMKKRAAKTILISGPSLNFVYWLLDRYDRNKSADGAFVFELHDAWDLCEERVVFADTDVDARLELCAALANQDRTAGHKLSGKALNSKPLRVTVAAVA
jgi:hypothetical protein